MTKATAAAVTAVVACFLLLLLLLPLCTYAYPNGAGQCLVGENSVGGPHLPSTTGSVTLSDIGITLSIDGAPIDFASMSSSASGITLESGMDHEVSIEATTGSPFRGFLFVLSSTDGTTDVSSGLVATDSLIGHPALACTSPTVGVTHFTSADKTLTSAILRVDSDADATVRLDVTVVMSVSGSSNFGYNGLPIVIAAAAEPEPAPTPAPTPGDTTTSTGAPSPATIIGSTAPPTAEETVSVPTTASTTAPVATPTTTTNAPVSSSTLVPTSSPTNTTETSSATATTKATTAYPLGIRSTWTTATTTTTTTIMMVGFLLRLAVVLVL